MITESQLQFSIVNDVMVVQLPAQSITQMDLTELDEQWLELVSEHKPAHMVVDFNHVSRFSSQAVGTLIRVSQRIRSAGGDIKLCSMSPRTQEIFRICRLVPGSFDLYASVGEALESFDEQ